MSNPAATSVNPGAVSFLRAFPKSAEPWLIPAIAISVSPLLMPWVAMWLIAASFFAAFKWITWRAQSLTARRGWRALGYFIAWPGLDSNRFFDTARNVSRPGPQSLSSAIATIFLGGSLIWGVTPHVPDDWPCLKGAIGFGGVILVLHFGAFQLLSLIWMRAGVDAPRVMDRPLSATSLADFWGRRWNMAYRRISYDLFFRPFVGRLGPTWGLLAAFLVSGVVHELVISLPVHGGYGGPTAYFLMQGAGLLLERTTWLRKAMTRHPAIGRCYAAAVVLAPSGWLFHRPFLTRSIVPFLHAIGA